MVRDVLNKYGHKIIDELRDDIKNKPLPRRGGKSYVANASGNLEKTLRLEIDESGFRIYANKYIGALVFGRKPTSNSGDGSLKLKIRQWIDDKGIIPYPDKKTGRAVSKDSLAYIITRKIHKEGTLLYPAGSDLLSAIITNDLMAELKAEIIMELTDVLMKDFKQLTKAA